MNNKTEIVFPKVLIIDNFNQKEANGITIRNLFLNWPKDRIAVAHREQSPISEIVVDNIVNYYLFGKKEINYIWPFSLILKIADSKIINSNTLDLALNSSKAILEKKQISIKVKLFEFFKPLIYFSGLAYYQKKFILSEDLKNWIKEFNPDYIYSSAGSISSIDFLCKVKEYFGYKLIVHTFDDYIQIHDNTVISKFLSKLINKKFRKLIELADLGLVISDKMATVYNKRYNKPFYKFHNPIILNNWKNSDTNDKLNVFTFCYIGKINFDTNSTIGLFIDTIEQLNKEGIKVDFHIYSQSNLNSWISLVGSRVKKYYKGSLSHSEIPNVLSKYDGLLLPLNFEKENQKYLELSLSTKTSEYMISKVPIFLIAPHNFAVSEYLKNNDCAYCINNVNELENGILDFMSQSELRRFFSEKAFQLAIEEHTSDAVTQRLLLTLNKF
jgi:glycosyltransferase involved in cell wall biosynthesis